MGNCQWREAADCHPEALAIRGAIGSKHPAMKHHAKSELELALRRWSLSDASQLADTRTSNVYRVNRGDGSPAVLKILKPYGADEIRGVHAMRWYAGGGSVEIYDCTSTQILMEWLPGRTLGDAVRAGDDGIATEELCNLVRQLHRPRDAVLPSDLMALEHQFRPLLEGGFDLWPPETRRLGERARQIARDLLGSMTDIVPLHGDLHHDNVMQSERGWQVIDAKGLIGDPAYDVSNTFRNPEGAGNLAGSPARAEYLVTTFANRLGYDRKRMLGWAIGHSALSIFWLGDKVDDFKCDLAMIPLLITLLDRA